MKNATARAIKQPVPEAGVLRACLDLLAVERIWHRRWNSGAMLNSSGRPVKFGKKGDADILATPVSMAFLQGTVLWIECKSDSGRETAEQVAFEREVSEAGHHYLVVRDVDTLKQWLIEHGVIRGQR
jgi:hypothetical protein